MRTFGQFPCSNQRANYFLKETCGFSGDVSESAADCRGRKNASGGKRRIPDRRKLPEAARNFRGMGVGLKPDWSAGWLSVEARCFKVAAPPSGHGQACKPVRFDGRNAGIATLAGRAAANMPQPLRERAACGTKPSLRPPSHPAPGRRFGGCRPQHRHPGAGRDPVSSEFQD